MHSKEFSFSWFWVLNRHPPSLLLLWLPFPFRFFSRQVRIFVAVLFLVSLVKVGSLQIESKYLRASDNKKMEIQAKHSGQEINAYFSEELSPPVHSSTGPITKQQKSAKPTTLKWVQVLMRNKCGVVRLAHLYCLSKVLLNSNHV